MAAAASKAAVAAFTQALAAGWRGAASECDRAVDHRHAGQPHRHAQGGPRRLAQARGSRRHDRVPRPRDNKVTTGGVMPVPGRT